MEDVLCSGCNYASWVKRRLTAPLISKDQTPPNQRYHKYHTAAAAGEHKGLTGLAAGCVAINLVMGSGFLALPRAYVQAGLVLSMIVLVITCSIVSVTVRYEVEVMARAEAVVKSKLMPEAPPLRGSLTPPRRALRAGLHDGSVAAAAAELQPLQPLKQRSQTGSSQHSSIYKLSHHTFQVSELCELFGGPSVRCAYDLTMVLYMFTTLWGYTAVFGKAMSANAPLPGLDDDQTYVAYVALFAAIVVPLSVVDVKEQVPFQILMTWLRFLTAVAMTGTVAVAWITGVHAFKTQRGGGVHGGPVDLFRFSGLRTIIPSVLFAVMLNSSVPVVVQALADKRQIR
jgi:hypothetical protein